MCPAAPVVRHRLKTARRHELDGGAERVADRQTEQSAAPSIQAKIRALTHAPDRIRVCRNGRDLWGGTCLGCRSSAGGETATGAAAATDPRADDARNVRLVGYNDLQGRESLVVTTLSDAANGSWVYVGHHESYWDQKPKLNPITGKEEWNGTSILDVADPANPKLVWHIPNETNRNSRGVSVVYDYKFDGSGRDYLIRNSEILTEGETGKDLKYQIFDITSRDTDPSKIALVSEITGTPPNSCGPGCGGLSSARAQRLVVAGHRLLLRRLRRARLPQRHHSDLRSEGSEGAEVRRPRVAAESEGRRAGLREASTPTIRSWTRSASGSTSAIATQDGRRSSTSPIPRIPSWCGRST